ncbi:unnamed protein product [Phaeothamnion confervicola]
MSAVSSASCDFPPSAMSPQGAGPLSGRKIDLSVNAYGHTHHLLCHDDVIGTRKATTANRQVSYIVYLVEKEWNSGEKPDGGALQLYPLEDPEKPGTPAFAPVKEIPPKWNQMVLFAVQPGHSFHDVQEVFSEDRPRLSVSGWFHGALEDEVDNWPAAVIEHGKLHAAECSAELATLAQLEERSTVTEGVSARAGSGGGGNASFVQDFGPLKDGGLEGWISPEYLADGAADQIAQKFVDNGSSIVLHGFLAAPAATKVAAAVTAADAADGLGYHEAAPFDVGVRGSWRPAGPPHRRRFLRLAPSGEEAAAALAAEGEAGGDDAAGAAAVRDELFGSDAFRNLLEKLTATKIAARRAEARRFRPGLDYTLAAPQPWDSAAAGDMILDAVLCFVDDVEEYKQARQDDISCFNTAAWQQDEVGGYQTYLGGEDDGGDDAGGGGKGDRAGSGLASSANGIEESGGGSAASGQHQGHDAAVYRSDDQVSGLLG